MLIEAIKTHALEAAEAGDFDTVAKALNTLTKEVYIGKVGGKASLSALVGAGIDPNTVIAAMRSVPMASELLNTLTASGVDWTDNLTAYVMQGLVSAGKITQQTADVMRGLSKRTAPLIETTADDCKRAWAAAKRDALRSRIDAAWNQIGTTAQDEAIAEFRAIADMLEDG